MLRRKGLTEKLLMLGIDGMDPRFTRRLVKEGKMPNVKKMMELGACRDDLMLLGANPTITPPMWATLATGAYPMTHGVEDFNLSGEDLEITYTAIYSHYMKAQPLWNITAEAGKKTVVWHWPGGAWPPTSDSPNLITVDGSSPGAVCSVSSAKDFDTVFIASTKAEKPSWMPYSIRESKLQGDEKLKFLGLPQKSSQSPEAKAMMKKYLEEYASLIHVEDYDTPAHFITNSIQFEKPEKEFSGRGMMWDLADFPTTCSISPIYPPQQWGFAVPDGAKEFVMLTFAGQIVRYCLILKDENGNELNYTLGQYEGDSTFLKVMKINILQGLSEREALKQYSTPVYINEQYARLLVPKGENPVGKPVRLYDTEFGKMEKEGEPIAIIAGIVENLYTGTLRQEVYPSLTYLTHTPPYNLVQIRLKKERRAEALALLQQTWEKINPNVPFEYQDIYEEFMLSNRKTIELAHLLIMYSIISLLLTAFGLFGMALYAIRQRTKEIGIRKVNGATAGEILYLLNRRFIGWVGIAFAIAVPITWYSLSCWLENFVYRVDISIGTCLLSGGIVLMVTLLTVSRHSYKAASRNPVNTLRSE